MNKHLISISIMFLGICILLSSWVYSNTLEKIANNERVERAVQPNINEDRYELIVVNENNIIYFDKVSGDYWRKFIESDEGPTEWEKQSLPF